MTSVFLVLSNVQITLIWVGQTFLKTWWIQFVLAVLIVVCSFDQGYDMLWTIVVCAWFHGKVSTAHTCYLQQHFPCRLNGYFSRSLVRNESWGWKLLYQENELSASSLEGLFSRHLGALEITFFVWTKFVLMRCYARSTNSH